MLSHIFKIIWKKKTSNFLMMLEIFFSFIVLFAVFSFSTYFYRNYRNASGMDIERTWVAYMAYNTDTMPNFDLIRQRLKTYPEIESFSFSSNNVPFGFSSSNTQVEYNNIKALSEVMHVEPEYPKALGMTISEGRWFTWEDTIGGKYTPIVITRALKETLFGDEDAIGKAWTFEWEFETTPVGYRVVGIVDHFKHKDDFQERSNCLFRPQQGRSDRGTILMKMKPGADANFEARLAKDLVNIGKDWSVEIQHLDAMKSTQNLFTFIPLLIALIVCAFLVVNVAMGLFGVLFQNINRRRGEIGVRRAMGATKSEILRHFVGETAMLTTFGVLLGLFFAVQFPLLDVFDVHPAVYGSGMAMAAAAIYALTLLCAWYPSRQAAAIFPADALRSE
jgi:putative ABC transport system permease protein